MRQFLICLISFCLALQLPAQPGKYISVAAFSTQNAMPFGKLGGLFKETLHPGTEWGMGKNINPKKNHEWFMELKLAYFFHRYVQHGIPLYFNFGYRYHIKKRYSLESSIGAGYMHSIPATAKLKLNNEGAYENNKGLGRMQAMATFGLGLGYVLNHGSQKTTKLFVNWQQRLQMPFVKSYVPLLPYNSFLIGITRPLRQN